MAMENPPALSDFKPLLVQLNKYETPPNFIQLS